MAALLFRSPSGLWSRTAFAAAIIERCGMPRPQGRRPPTSDLQACHERIEGNILT
jgi:hypothetical protein